MLPSNAQGEEDEYIQQFWQVLREFSGQERKQFLGFVWGRSRLPAQPSQPFTIDSGGGRTDSTLPMSHTCMVCENASPRAEVALPEADATCFCVRAHMQFQLHLPHYSTKEILKARLLTAVQNAGTRSDSGGADAKQKHTSQVEVAMPRSLASTATYVLQPTSGCVGHRERLSDLCERKSPRIVRLVPISTEVCNVSAVR
jgi:hypothetical protein